MPPQSTPEVERLVAAVVEWIDRRGDLPTPADADHSSLLRRLLGGEAAFPFQPPRRFSYPDYSMAAGVPVTVMEVWEHDGQVIIDQSAWNIIERRQDGGYLVEWPGEPGSRYTVAPRDPANPTVPQWNRFTVTRGAP